MITHVLAGGSITERQNNPGAIRLLRAQRELYSEAKRWRRTGARAVVVSAIVGLTATILVPAALKYVGPLGAVVATAQWLLSLVERQRTMSAAAIQEQFDTSVLPLPWNDVLCGYVDPEDVVGAAERHKGPDTKLTDWYPLPAGVAPPHDVLLCQRMNLRWDSKLRRGYANNLLASLSFLALLLVAAGVARQLTVGEWVLAVLPTIGAFRVGAEAIRAQRQHGFRQESLKKKVEAIWAQAKADPDSVGVPEHRAVQDGIYHLRVTAPPVPDTYYLRKRQQFEREAQTAAAVLWDEAKKLSS